MAERSCDAEVLPAAAPAPEPLPVRAPSAPSVPDTLEAAAASSRPPRRCTVCTPSISVRPTSLGWVIHPSRPARIDVRSSWLTIDGGTFGSSAWPRTVR